MAKTIQLQGFKEIETVLTALGKSMGQKVVRQQLRRGAKPLIKKTKENASNADVTGNLTRSIGFVTDKSEGYSEVVGPRRGRGKTQKGHHAHLVEYGTAPHSIAPKKGGVLKFGEYYSAKAQHPGSAAYPFMRPAWEVTKEEVQKEIANGLREVISSNFNGVFK